MLLHPNLNGSSIVVGNHIASKIVSLLLLIACYHLGFECYAKVSRDMPYPKGTPTADEIAEQVYFVNHFFAVKNLSWEKKGSKIAVLINKRPGKRPTINTVERHFNNRYGDGVVRARDLAIFRSGKLRGTGILITDYEDINRSQDYSIWLPAMRKIRRHMEPAHNDAWGGSVLTYGDIYLRRPHDESHKLLGVETFEDCLDAMELTEEEHVKWTRIVQEDMKPSCAPKGRRVYKVKSTTTFDEWWYDYRIVYVDRETFADYRSVYYQEDKVVKILDKHWSSMGLDDPRALYWLYWYARSTETGTEGMAVIPAEVIQWNRKVKPSLWTEKTLRKLKR